MKKKSTNLKESKKKIEVIVSQCKLWESST